MRLAPESFRSTVFVVIQFACLIVIFFNVNLIPVNFVIGFGIVFFLILGIWAVTLMKFSFNIAPDIPTGKELILKGPYKFIRHPMYTSVLGITIFLILNDFNYIRIIFFLILLINLLFKLNYEEKLLTSKFSEYTSYKKSTKRLIPYIY